jgi:hypothetical protein
MEKIDRKVIWIAYLTVGGLFGMMLQGTAFMIIGLMTGIILAYNF